VIAMSDVSMKIVIAAVAISSIAATLPAAAEQVIEDAGVIVCVNDKWEEKEIGKDHKIADYAGRCVKVPDAAGAAKVTEECTGKYEYKPDGSWQANGTCVSTIKEGQTLAVTWQEGSKLDPNPYQITGGTGQFKGATGSGTYKYDQLTTTLFGGRYQGRVQLP
jgi:hypothetical protein